MAETINPETQIAPEPELTRRIVDPKGVLQKNMKLVLYLSAALLVIVAAVFSSSGKKTVGAQAATKNQSPQPTVQDNTDNNVAELKSQLQAEQQKEQQEAASNVLPQGGTLAQQSAAAAYGPTGQSLPCASGQPCSQAYGQQASGQAISQYIINEPGFRVLRPDYREFTHRKELCSTIDDALKSDRTFVTSLTGIGGVGKTALACWAALRAHDSKKFDYIVSLTAKDRALTSTGIVPLAPTLSSLSDLLAEISDVTGFSELSQIDDLSERIKAVKSSILSQFRGLLFVDNLETVDDPQQYRGTFGQVV